MKHLAMATRGIIFLLICFMACKPEDNTVPQKSYPAPTPFTLNRPVFFPEMDIPIDNQFTVEGISLGKKLFFDQQLSNDNTISCASCHLQENAFADPRKFSEGVNQQKGTRNAMALFNLGYARFYFWDGRAKTLEQQILEPVPNPIEMHQSWGRTADKLSKISEYPDLFGEAFGNNKIDSTKITKAIAQYLRTLVSANSKFDQYRRGEAQLTPEEFAGLDLFLKEGGDPETVNGGQNGADCFHCHGFGDMQFTDGLLHNNGLDSEFTDKGAGAITGRAQDIGRFKTPSLRNVEYTAPYMHDGRFKTLEEVIEHYNSGGHPSPTIDPFMKYTTGGLNLTAQKKTQLIAFLKTLSDPSFIKAK